MYLTGTLLYFGSPSAHEQIAADLRLDGHHLELRIRNDILWESETATDAEVRAMEVRLIRELRSNDPAIGYNHPSSASSNLTEGTQTVEAFEQVEG
jgi:hypothetical protein